MSISHAKKPPILNARFVKRNDEAIEVPNEETASDIVAQLDGVDFSVASVQTREKRRNPVAPFITSTLQQESSRKLRFSVKRTMMLAQASVRRQRARQRRRCRSHHLHAYRLDARFERRDRRSPSIYSRAVRTELCTRGAERLQEQEGCAGCARGDPSHFRAPHAREPCELSRRRRAEAVPVDLDALRRVADDAGCFRPDHHRSHGARARTTTSIVSAQPVPCRSSTASLRSTRKARIRRTKMMRS